VTEPTTAAPLRVPELGPYLGRIVAAGGRPGRIPLDAIRLRLATRVMECAGEARRLAGEDEREATIHMIGPERWEGAWREAADAVGALVLDAIESRLGREAEAVRMPRRRLARYVPSESDKTALRSRLLLAGLDLTGALEALRSQGEALAATSRSTDELVERWQRTITLTARKLESAWIELERRAEEQLDRWEPIMDDVAAWRRPLWPVATVAAFGIALATWFGLVFGGYVDAPPWLVDAWGGIFGR
jgi:hypothetical protein